jgi:hypothetical protein
VKDQSSSALDTITHRRGHSIFLPAIWYIAKKKLKKIERESVSPLTVAVQNTFAVHARRYDSEDIAQTHHRPFKLNPRLSRSLDSFP